MAVAFLRGSTTGPSDLAITVRGSGGNLIDPYRLEYSVYDFTTGIEVLMGGPNAPVKSSTGQYYAQVIIPADGNIGLWRIRWTVQETAVDPVYQSVQEFQVVGSSIVPVSFSGDPNLDALIYSLRVFLRDNNPDRNYRLRPPSSEKFIQGQTQVFGFIWEDEELYEYLLFAIDDFNSRPPVTGINLYNLFASERRWRTTILIRAAAFACFAIAMNWIVDEMSYSISGISLDLEKSSKYQSMKDEFVAEYDKMVEQNKLSIKIIKGLRQFRYGVGITSALGPLSRPGVQSRRNLLGSLGG